MVGVIVTRWPEGPVMLFVCDTQTTTSEASKPRYTSFCQTQADGREPEKATHGSVGFCTACCGISKIA